MQNNVIPFPLENYLCSPTGLNNYRPIFKLSILATVLERLVMNQIKEYMCLNNILSPHHSGFRKLHKYSNCCHEKGKLYCGSLGYQELLYCPF